LASFSANQIGVGIAAPFLRKVVRDIYFCPLISDGIGTQILYGAEGLKVAHPECFLDTPGA